MVLPAASGATRTGQNVNDNGGNFTEFDYSLDYTNTIPGIDWLSGSAGVIHYTFPHTEFASTTEVYGGLTLNESAAYAVY